MAKIKSMLFKTVSDEKWRDFKIACTRADIPMTTAVAGFMTAVLDGELKLGPDGKVFTGTDKRDWGNEVK